jgi:ATP-binding cassette subfamily B protein
MQECWSSSVDKKNMASNAGRHWILQNSRTQYRKIFLLSLLCMVSSALGVGFALLLKQVVDEAVDGNMQGFFRMSVITSSLVLLQLLIGYAIRYLDERSRADLENTLKRNVWAKILTRDYGSLTEYHTGELMNRLSNDVKVVADSIVTLAPSLVSMITKLLCALVILFLLDYRFTLIFVAGGCAVVGFSVLFRRIMKQMHKKMQEAEGKLRSFQQEMLESVLVIRSFQAEEKIGSLGDGYMKVHKQTRLRRNLFSNISQTGFSIIINAGYLFGIIWCGLGIIGHTISYGTLLAVQQLIGQVQQPIANIAGIIPRYYSMTASAERLLELEELPEDDCAEEEIIGQEISGLEKLDIVNLTTSYGKDREKILEDANLTIYQGDIMAVTGESGAGKSTLLKLLLCLYPFQKGSVEVTDKEQRVYRLNKGLRHLFAYVPQGNFLMSGTIREVVTLYGMKGCISVEQACKNACASEFIESLEEGYDTVLGERGVGLSEGQMQRLAIARALYIGSPVLLLDEATSALDSNTEVQVLKNIRELKDKTVVIVTHRPAALEICNRKVEIINKKIQER